MKTPSFEIISEQQTAGNLWEEVNREFEFPVFNQPSNSTYRIRLLGPFIKAKRVYLPSELSYNDIPDLKITRKDVVAILNGNYEVYSGIMDEIKGSVIELCKMEAQSRNEDTDPIRMDEDLLKGVQQVSRKNLDNRKRWKVTSEYSDKQPDTFKEMRLLLEYGKLLGVLHNKEKWLDCILTNALIEIENSDEIVAGPSRQIAILQLSKSMVDLIISHCRSIANMHDVDASDIKLSGLYAHDISLTKQGNGSDAKYIVQLESQPTHLPKDKTDFIFSEELYDISSVISAVNRNNDMRTGFLYSIEKKYKMPEEMYDTFQKDFQNGEKDIHHNEAYGDMSNLPKDAIDSSFDKDNPISWICI